MRKILAAVLAVILLTAAFGSAGAEAEARRIETAADAEEWTSVLFGETPETLDSAWATTADMKAALGSAGLKGLAQAFAAYGRAERIGPAHEGRIQGYTVWYVPCVLSAVSLDILLVIQDGAVAGIQTGEYTGGQEAAEPDLYDSTELALPVQGLGELPGILTVPRGEGPFPAAVLLPGSGPSDMDETTGMLKPFRDIAEGLAAHGIAVYRFDKRTYAYGAQLAADTQLTPEDEYLEDTVTAVRLLTQQDRIDPDRIFVLGHSLGGMLIPAAAAELEKAGLKARGFIMMAASARPLDVLMREQYDFIYSLTPEITAEQQAEKDLVFSQLDRLQDPDSLAADEVIAGAYPAYWKWLAAYDTLQAAEAIRQPVLLLQGEEDYQVTTDDYSLWQKRLGNKAGWRMISYPGLTHLFMTGLKTEGPAAYAREGKVDAQVLEDIAAFIGSPAP